jgi:long-chain acyl-CoA synthetase
LGDEPVTDAPFLPRSAGHESELALRSPTAERTWSELEGICRRVANGFHALGLAEGDRVCVMAGNRVEYVEVMLASLRGGTRVVPINWHLTAPEVAYMLSDSGARVLVCDSENAAVARAAAMQAGLAEVIVIGEDYDAWQATQSDAEPANHGAGGPMFYTSGTTGRPKGVISRARETTLEDAWELWRRNAATWCYRQTGGTHLVACPIYHAAPYANVLMAVAMGQGLALMPRFDAEDFLHQVAAHRVTTTHVVPTQMTRLARLPGDVKERYDTSSLVHLVHGAAPCPGWVKQQLIDWLGPVIVEYYAFSEGAGSTFASSAEWLAKPGTVGKPAEGVEMLIADDGGHAVAQGDVGTLYFRRPGVPLPEYHNAPEKTASSMLEGGWFTVGDVGWVDEDGYLFLSDRKIDMIISGGVNIYPAEVEAALSEHPAVEDCAVFGVPDDEWGESVKAAVALAPSARGDAHLDEHTLIGWCRERIAAFKCPTSIDFVHAVPREASGKMMKRKLRDPYWEGKDRRI